MGLISNGTTIFDAGALDSGLAKGAMTFIKKLTASSSGTLTFHNGASSVVLDNTYKEYLFTFKDIHPSATSGNPVFSFQGNAVGESGYNEAITSTHIRCANYEDDSDRYLSYGTGKDQAQGTSFQSLVDGDTGGDNDQSFCGTLHLFNPSSTTFVKHYIAKTHTSAANDVATTVFNAGYFNTTAAIDEIQFKMSTGNIDVGDICLYGIS